MTKSYYSSTFVKLSVNCICTFLLREFGFFFPFMEWITLHILRPGPTTIWIQTSRSTKMGQHFDLRRFLCPRLMTSIWKRKFRWVTLSNNSTLFHDPVIGELMKFPWNHNLPLRTACGQLRRRISFPKVHYLSHYGTAWSDHISALMSVWLIVFGMFAKKIFADSF